MTYYDEIIRDFPKVTLHMIKNKNYEYGAWKYILELYPNFDIYWCIQDSLLLHRPIQLQYINDTTSYTFHHFSGFYHHPSICSLGTTILNNSDLNCLSIINTDFNLAQHCSFIVNNTVINKMFNQLKMPPTNKDGSCCYERIFGLFFLCNKINTINLHRFMDKTHGNRT